MLRSAQGSMNKTMAPKHLRATRYLRWNPRERLDVSLLRPRHEVENSEEIQRDDSEPDDDDTDHDKDGKPQMTSSTTWRVTSLATPTTTVFTTHTSFQPLSVKPPTRTTSFHGSSTSLTTPSMTLGISTSTTLASSFLVMTSASQSRNGINDNDKDYNTTEEKPGHQTPATISATAAAEIETTSTAGPHIEDNHGRPLSPTTEKVLIAAGTVGKLSSRS